MGGKIGIFGGENRDCGGTNGGFRGKSKFFCEINRDLREQMGVGRKCRAFESKNGTFGGEKRSFG